MRAGTCVTGLQPLVRFRCTRVAVDVGELAFLTPAQRGPRRAGLLAFRPPGRFRSALLERRRAPGTVVLRGLYRGVSTVAREQVLQPVQLGRLPLELLYQFRKLRGHRSDLRTLTCDHGGLRAS